MDEIRLSNCIRYAVQSCCDAELNEPPSTDAALAAGVALYCLERQLREGNTPREPTCKYCDGEGCCACDD